MNAKIICLALLVSSSVAWADDFFYSDEPIDANVRLESIKASLLDYALDHSVYVSTQAWLDGNGAVEEKVLLLSGLNLERIRVNEYRNAFGLAQASIIDAPLSSTESWSGCPVTSPVKRRLELVTSIEQTATAAARNLASEAQQAVLNSLMMSAELAAAADPFAKPRKGGSVYAQFMQQPAAKNADLALHINVAVQQRASRSLLAPSLREAGNALTVELVMTELGEAIYQVEYKARVPKTKLAAAMPYLSGDLLGELATKMTQVAADLGDLIRCQASSKLNVAQFRGQLRVDGGSDLGVFRGQEFLLVPSSRGFATRGLENALQSVALARVERVYGQYASLAVVTGATAEMMGGEMIAVPLAAMNFM
jgi:hypothetical protein